MARDVLRIQDTLRIAGGDVFARPEHRVTHAGAVPTVEYFMQFYGLSREDAARLQAERFGVQHARH
jgi:hypothetical protein